MRSFATYRLAYVAATLIALGFTIDFYAERRAVAYRQALVEHGWLEPAR